MAVISLFSPKGGVGKSTCSLLLGLGLAKKGYDIAMIDADPNASLSMWSSSRDSVPIRIIKQSGEGELPETINDEARQGRTVIIDLDGRASTRATHAIMMSDLVLVPFSGSVLDTDLALTAKRLISSTAQARGREIGHFGVLTKCPGNPRFYSRELMSVVRDLEAGAFPMLKTAIAERQAYRSLFSFGGLLEELPKTEVPGVPQAIQNAAEFTDEVEGLLLEEMA